jgi:hypothetical protein
MKPDAEKRGMDKAIKERKPDCGKHNKKRYGTSQQLVPTSAAAP